MLQLCVESGARACSRDIRTLCASAEAGVQVHNMVKCWSVGVCDGARAASHALQPSRDLSSFRGYPCLSAWAMYSSLNPFPGNIHAIMAWTARKKAHPQGRHLAHNIFSPTAIILLGCKQGGQPFLPTPSVSRGGCCAADRPLCPPGLLAVPALQAPHWSQGAGDPRGRSPEETPARQGHPRQAPDLCPLHQLPQVSGARLRVTGWGKWYPQGMGANKDTLGHVGFPGYPLGSCSGRCHSEGRARERRCPR